MTLSKLSLKLDAELQSELRQFEIDPESLNAATSVILIFSGDISRIEALGFETHLVDRNEAMGIVNYRDIRALVDLDEVQLLTVGEAPRVDLAKAAQDVRARAAQPGDVASKALWNVDEANGVLAPGAVATGKNVLIAIIDTGIDADHPAFLASETPKKKTRIWRIWDMGRTADNEGQAPDPALLGSAQTYGREWDQDEIDTALNAGSIAGGLDCAGHGTHVAGIAAGGPVHYGKVNPIPVGIAPEAELIVVNYLGARPPIKFGWKDNFGADVKEATRFRDAILYCLRVAKARGWPLVVNMSFGNMGEAGDGLDPRALWLDARLAPDGAGQLSFPKGVIAVTGSGNLGGDSARIEMPAKPDGVTLPLTLTDTREGIRKKAEGCNLGVFSPAVSVVLWYHRSVPLTETTVELKLPKQAGFAPPVGVGGHLLRSFKYRAGQLVVLGTTHKSATHFVELTHHANSAVPLPQGGTVWRHKIVLTIRPRTSKGVLDYATPDRNHSKKLNTGSFELKLKAPAGTVFHCACERLGWARKKVVGFGIAKTMSDGTPRDASIDVGPSHSIVDGGSRFVISAAAHDTGAAGAIAAFSSWGPLRAYAAPGQTRQPVAEKPDVSAPGVDIRSAETLQSISLAPRLPKWTLGDRYIEQTGTSMAAPMVAGTVALMLQRNKTLNSLEVRKILRDTARTAVNPPPSESDHKKAYGAGRLDAYAAVMAVKKP